MTAIIFYAREIPDTQAPGLSVYLEAGRASNGSGEAQSSVARRFSSGWLGPMVAPDDPELRAKVVYFMNASRKAQNLPLLIDEDDP